MHPYQIVDDEVGYNYRLPNFNAALGCAQIDPLPGTTANWWLNVIVLESEADRDVLLEYTNSGDVMTRPIWRLMLRLPMLQHCQHDGLENSRWLEARVVNLPSSVPESEFGRLKASE